MKRAVIVMVLAICASVAHAAVSVTPDPIDVGPVDVGSDGTATGTLTGGAADLVDLDLSACDGELAVTPDSLISLLTPVTLTATLTPTSAGAKSCTVNVVEDVGGATVGTFTITGTADAPGISAPSSVNFGSVRVTTGATSTQPVAITNTGTADLHISNLTVAGDYAFQSAPALPITVPAGTATNVGVVFDPTASGTRTSTLVITSDALGATTTDVALTGVGTNAAIGVTANVDFAVVANGTTSSKAITVTNTGAAPTGPLHVSTATLDDTSGWFAFDAADGCTGNPCTVNTDVTTTLAFKVTCKPTPATATGTNTATVMFASDADNTGSNVTTLSCTAGRAVLGVTPPSIDFSTVLVGQQSTQTVTISNAGGTEPLTYSLAVTGAQASQFTLGNGCVTSCAIAVGGPDATIDVTYKPPAPGASAATLAITNNSPGDSPTNIALTGTGIAPKISTPATVAFGSIEVNSSTTKSLTITNTGTADLHITTAALSASATDYAVITGTTGAQTVPANGTATWQLSCTPSTFGARPGSFVIASDAFNTPSASVTLACTGLQGVLSLDSTTMAFGGVRLGDTATQSVTLRNIGNAPVALTSQTLSSTTVGYSFTTTLPATLAALATTTVTVQFAPVLATDGGNITATFSGTSGTTVVTPTSAVLNISGSGLTADYSTSTPTLAFGDMRWDTTLTQTFQIIQTDAPKITIETLGIAPDMSTGTVTGELTVTAIKHGAATVALPFQLQAANDALTITVQAKPANRLGQMVATLTVHSDLGDNPDRQIALSANSTSPMLTLTPSSAVVDFGGVDLQAGPAMQTITILNSGDGPLDMGAIQTSGSARYTYVKPTAQTLAANAMASIDVTYTPTLEAADTGTVVVPLAGIFGDSPASQTIMIQGHGIDRHINVPTQVMFPDTFVYPATPPVMPVSVHNSGEAPLHLSMLAATTQWAVTNPGVVDVAGNDTFQVMIQFDPTVVGADNGTLTITDNDTGLPMAIVQLHGNGIDRDVQVGPSTINLGVTGVGDALHLKDLAGDGLTVLNMDASATFAIHMAGFTDDPAFPANPAQDAFTIVQPPADLALAPGSTASFDIVFQTDTPGTYHVLANVFLDADPNPQTVPVTAQAVFVDAHGGGGCSAGGGGVGIAMIAVVLLVLRRRRAAVLLFSAGIASADNSRNLDVSVFDPTPATTGTNFQLQAPTVGSDGDWAAFVMMSYARDPLVLDTGTNDAAIANRLQYDLGGAYAFLGRFEAGAHMPLFTQSGDAASSPGDPAFRDTPASGTARGDLTLHAKAHLLQVARASLGLAGSLTLPTATSDQFAGVSKPEGRVLALASYAPMPQLSVSLNLGAVLRAREHFQNIDEKSGVAWGVGASYRVSNEMWVAAELFGEEIPGGKTDVMGGASLLSTSEYLVGLHMQIAEHAALGLALGRGLDSGVGSPAVRGVLALTYVPNSSVAPLHPPLPPVPDGDADGDGIPDSIDKCPNEPEDKDMYEDADGCPDPDNDHDGIPDDKDKCPLDPEDKDGFQDEDGCPDRDNDGDGIPDERDKCPNEPEDKDGFQDLDGCPDPDNDNDGIPDTKDKCPNDPETINGIQDEDGCPDNGPSAVAIAADRIDTFVSIKFTGTQLAKSSNNVLGQIGATLRAHKEIARVRIASHVQPSRDPDRDLDITTKRAEAIRDWLVKYGIETKRLDVHGFGGTKPLDKNGGASVNDRIEIIIMERQ